MAKTISAKEVKDEFTRDMVKALSVLGYNAMMDAYKKRTFKHKTRNLHDSYGSAVYVNGVIVESSIRYIGTIYSRRTDPRTKKTGRQTLNDYLRRVRFGEKNQEIVLVVAAAMYYAGILEAGDKSRGARGPGSKYIVISPARSYINSHMEEAVMKVYKKWGIKERPKARVIKGENIKV